MIPLSLYLHKLRLHHPDIAMWLQASREPQPPDAPPRGLPAPHRTQTRSIYKADVAYPPLPDELIAVIDCTD